VSTDAIASDRSRDPAQRSSRTAISPTRNVEGILRAPPEHLGCEPAPDREGDIVRVRHLALVLAAGATVLAVVSGLGACSSSGGASGLPSQSPAANGTPSPAPPSAFGQATNKQYGISIRYPLGWVSAARTAPAGDTSGAPLLSVSWADSKGKVVNGGFVDVLHVSVYALTKPVKPNDVVRYAASFKGIAAGLIKGLPGLKLTEPFKPLTLNGTKGIQITYTYMIHNTPTGAMSYLLPKGRYAYWVSGQSSADTWAASWSKLAPAMASFTIKPVKTK